MTGTNLIRAWGLASFSKKTCSASQSVLPVREAKHHHRWTDPITPHCTMTWWKPCGYSPPPPPPLAQIHPSLLRKPSKNPDSSHVLQALTLPSSRCTVELIKGEGAVVVIWGRTVHNPGRLTLLEYNGRHLAAAGGVTTQTCLGGNGGREQKSPLALLTSSKHFDTASCLRYLPSANLLKGVFWII